MDWPVFATYLAACFAAAATGAMFQPAGWYDGLAKPRWTPPGWVFPVVWTTLYLCMAFAAMRVSGLAGNGQAMAFWALQIALNTLWTPVFFGAKRMGFSVVVMGALVFAVLGMLVTFWRLDGLAALMLVPYVAWLALAAPLNIWIWRNNRGV